MEICDRKYMFGEKSTFGSRMVKTKGHQEKILFCTLNKGQFPTL